MADTPQTRRISGSAAHQRAALRGPSHTHAQDGLLPPSAGPGQARRPALPGRGAVSATDPEISVVIPHLNQPGALAACLDALGRQTLAPGRFEVVVVDNGSRPLPTHVVASLPEVHLAYAPEPGPGPARNRGVALARAEILAFLDADCIPDPGWLAAILAAFAAEPATAVLGGAVRVFAERPGRPSGAEAFDLVYGFRQELTIARHDFAATANLAVRRAAFAAVGGFAGLAVSEDMDWGRRAKLAGFPTRFVAEARVAHPARRSMDDLRGQWDRHVSHYWSMQPKSLRGRAAWALRAAAVAATPLAEIPHLLASDRLHGPRQRLAAFRTLAGVRLYRARRMLAALAGPTAPSARWNR
jgi:GT2 family glycosyltransferase